jgi:Bacterial regulatory proteins, luxR family
MSFREIGERLFVSRNTVKTQAISVYRKLGVSSRSEAIDQATKLGLLEDPGTVRAPTPSETARHDGRTPRGAASQVRAVAAGVTA